MAVALNGKRGIEFGTGTIEAANEKGIKVSGTWINYSKYPGGRPQDMPEGLDIGDRVQYKADGNFIKDLRLAAASLPGIDPWADEAEDRKRIERELAAPFAQVQAEEGRKADHAAAANVELRITRLACLKAAAAAAKPGTTAAQLIADAQQLATWAMGAH